MQAPRAAKEGVKFVDHDRLQRPEQPQRVRRAPDQHRLDRLRSDQHHATRVLAHPRLRTLWSVTVPAHEGQTQALAQPIHPARLVIDERLQRAHVQYGKARPFVIGRPGQEREECRLSLARRSRGGDQDVIVPAENGGDRLILDLPEFRPSLIADPALNVTVKQVEGGWHPYRRNVASSSSSSASPMIASSSFATSTAPINGRQSVPGFCSSTARNWTNALIVLRGVRK